MDVRNPANRGAMKKALEAELGRRSFAKYIRLCWNRVEPNELRWNWHMDAMAEFCMGLYLGHFRNGLINVPPGMSKSLIVSTFFPSWCWINDPTTRIISATYAQDLSEKNSKLHRDLVMTRWHQDRWPNVVIDKDSTKKVRLFDNTAKGWRFSSSVTGQMTGRHADLLIFDDLLKAQDATSPLALEKANEFWFSTMATRRADPKTTMKLGIMQRLSADDTAARCIETGDYEVLCLPMEFEPDRKCIVEVNGLRIEDPRTEEGELLNPDRFPREVVEADKHALGSRSFAAQMQQSPVPSGGNIFKEEWFQTWRDIPKDARYIITVDAAFKDEKTSDYTCCQVWASKSPHFYLVDQMHEKANVMRTCEMILTLKQRYPEAVGVYVEDKANGPAIIQLLASKITGVVAWPEKGSKMNGMNKVSRAEAVSALFESKSVHVPDENQVGWVARYMTEMMQFPVGKNDDQVDATTMALLILHKRDRSKYASARAKMARGGMW
jgi:predicted phage terminase large subunit-like protein